MELEIELVNGLEDFRNQLFFLSPFKMVPVSAKSFKSPIPGSHFRPPYSGRPGLTWVFPEYTFDGLHRIFPLHSPCRIWSLAELNVVEAVVTVEGFFGLGQADHQGLGCPGVDWNLRG